jgi:YVTN family beta-propeller protein
MDKFISRLYAVASATSVAKMALCLSLVTGLPIAAQAHRRPTFPPKTGVTTPGVQRPISSLQPLVTLHLPLNPDWFTTTRDGLWVTSSRSNVVTKIDASTNETGATVTVSHPCSGLAVGFGSLWIPSCGDHALVRADIKTGKIIASVAAGPAQSEGGVTTGEGSVWLVTDKAGVLSRIDPRTNRVAATINIPSGSYNPLYAGGYVWVTSNEHSELIQVDPKTNRVVRTIPTGKNPRFLTFGDGSIWTLNQGDGTISRIDVKTATRVANIEAGIPGFGGEITFGFHSAWATLFGFPITRVDAKTNKVVAQWNGPGGDSIRAAHGSIWLTNYKTGDVWRFAPPLK